MMAAPVPGLLALLINRFLQCSHLSKVMVSLTRSASLICEHMLISLKSRQTGFIIWFDLSVQALMV